MVLNSKKKKIADMSANIFKVCKIFKFFKQLLDDFWKKIFVGKLFWKIFFQKKNSLTYTSSYSVKCCYIWTDIQFSISDLRKLVFIYLCVYIKAHVLY